MWMMCVRWNGNTYLIMWIYVFDNVDMRVRWICPYAWRNVRCAFHGLFVGILRNVRWTFRWCSQRYRNPFAAVGVRFIVPAYTYSQRIRNPFRIHSRNVRNVFVICVLHIRRVKVWFLRCKSMVFGVQKLPFGLQKPPFWPAKSGFLYLRKYIKYFYRYK